MASREFLFHLASAPTFSRDSSRESRFPQLTSGNSNFTIMASIAPLLPPAVGPTYHTRSTSHRVIGRRLFKFPRDGGSLTSEGDFVRETSYFVIAFCPKSSHSCLLSTM